jgi:glycerol-3-phosphate dehydrogenase
MAEDGVDHAITLGRLRDEACTTKNLHIHGYMEMPETENEDPLLVYGADAAAIRALAKERPELAQRLHAELPYIAAEVVWAARAEMARSVEECERCC